jgi:opacity protein-like surface antigen
MKRLIAIVFCLSFVITQLNAQDATTETKSEKKQRTSIANNNIKGWYVTVQGGLIAPFFTSNRRSPFPEIGDKDFFEYKRNNVNVVKDQSVKRIFDTYAKGYNAGISGGYMYNNHFGVDFTLMYSQYSEDLDARIVSDAYTAEQRTSGITLNIAPALTMRFSKKRFGIYNKLGPIIPVFTSLKSKVSINDKEGRFLSGMFNWPIKYMPEGLTETIVEGTAKTTLKSAIGLKGAIGIEYMISPKISLIGEANASLCNIKIKETIFEEQYMKFSVLGIPSIEYKTVDEVPEYLKHYVWVDEITENSNSSRFNSKYDLSKPQEEIGQKINISSIYINVGLRINIPNNRPSKRQSL